MAREDAVGQREMLLIDILRTGLDIRAKAAAAEAPMLVYLVDLLTHRAREELEAVGVLGDAGSVPRDD